MTKSLILAGLALLALAACRHPQTQASPDYNGVRQRADAAHQDLDQQSK